MKSTREELGRIYSRLREEERLALMRRFVSEESLGKFIGVIARNTVPDSIKTISKKGSKAIGSKVRELLADRIVDRVTDSALRSFHSTGHPNLVVKEFIMEQFEKSVPRRKKIARK